MYFPRTICLSLFGLAIALAWTTGASAQANKELETLKVGDTAKDFELLSLKDEKIKLSELTEEGPVVLVVLRGFPGYQCPICSRQVGDLVKHAKEFKAANARVVFVYPGPPNELKQRAEEFLGDEELPEPFTLVIDPDYSFTKLYNLRWDAPRETAYPSTFVLDKDRVVKFSKVSTTHGDRAKTEDVIKAVAELPDTSAANL